MLAFLNNKKNGLKNNNKKVGISDEKKIQTQVDQRSGLKLFYVPGYDEDDVV